MSAEAMPVCITQSEYMRRMKDMSKLQEGMAFYGEMPDMYNLVLNANHPLVKDMLEGMKHDTAGTVEPLMAELRGMRARQAALTNLQNSKSDDAEAKEAAEESKKVYQEISNLEQKRDEALASYAAKQEKMSQLVDLALLSQGLLKGESLSQFINRSVDLLG
jgi:molecular chaperone HtpG